MCVCVCDSHSVVFSSSQPDGLYSPWDSPGQNTGVGSLSLLQGIFPTRGSNLGLSNCRQILYQLSHKGSPRILEWGAFPFSRGSSHPEIKPRSPALQGYSLPTELSGKPPPYLIIHQIGRSLTDQILCFAVAPGSCESTSSR